MIDKHSIFYFQIFIGIHYKDLINHSKTCIIYLFLAQFPFRLKHMAVPLILLVTKERIYKNILYTNVQRLQNITKTTK